MRVGEISTIADLASLIYRQAVAGSKFDPDRIINEPGAVIGLFPAPPVTAAIDGMGRAVNVKLTGATPGTNALTVTSPAVPPRVAVMVDVPSAAVKTVGDERIAEPCETDHVTGANGYARLPCASNLTVSGRSSGAVASRDCLSPATSSNRKAGMGVNTRIR